MAAQPLQKRQLFRGFHALGNHLQLQTAGHGDNRANDLGFVRVSGRITDKRLVDFQRVHWQTLEVSQRRITGAEIVHGINTASGKPNKEKVASLTAAQVEEIAKTKMPDLNAASLEAACSMVRGTCRSMGVTVEG